METGQPLIDVLKEITKELQGINEKLNHLCTQGMFVKIDDDINGN